MQDYLYDTADLKSPSGLKTRSLLSMEASVVYFHVANFADLLMSKLLHITENLGLHL